jgi:4-amino-4-deoxy-L-arabinose transferase-like glycosyltransferase
MMSQTLDRIRMAAVVLLFLAAAALRLAYLDGHELLPDREYHSALITRSLYFQGADGIPEWRREVALAASERQPLLEPPLLEWLTVALYGLAGGAYLWIPHALSTLFYLAGGLAFFWLARELIGRDGAIVAVGYYLFIPLGVATSVAFQPDALMMMLFLMTLAALARYASRPTLAWLLAAAVASGLALLVRPLVLFPIFAVFLAVCLRRKPGLRGLLNRHTLLFTLISLAPAAAYYGYTVLFDGVMFWKVTTSFMPHLFLTREYWRDWLLVATNSLGAATLIVALVGGALFRPGLPMAFALALAASYILFGLVFNVHIHTHDYYHLQLIPLVGMSLGLVVAAVLGHLRRAAPGWLHWLPVGGALLLLALFTFRETRATMSRIQYESQETAEEIGEIVGHSTRTVFLSRYYGAPLLYYAEIAGAYWPRRITYWLYRAPGERELSIEERLAQLDFTPEYFVITHMSEYERNHADLRAYLASCPLVAASDAYLVYRYCE